MMNDDENNWDLDDLPSECPPSKLNSRSGRISSSDNHSAEPEGKTSAVRVLIGSRGRRHHVKQVKLQIFFYLYAASSRLIGDAEEHWKEKQW